jgi:hypothetical protein
MGGGGDSDVRVVCVRKLLLLPLLILFIVHR